MIEEDYDMNELWETLKNDPQVQQVVDGLETGSLDPLEEKNLQESLKKSVDELHVQLLFKTLDLAPSMLRLFTVVQELESKSSTIEQQLVEFHERLDSVTNKIEDLQITTKSMEALETQRLELKSLLSNYINQVLVTPELAHKIHFSPLTSQYLETLHELQGKWQRAQEPGRVVFPSARESWVEGEALRKKALERVYKHWNHLFNVAMKSPSHFFTMQKRLVSEDNWLLHFLAQYPTEEAKQLFHHYTCASSHIYQLCFKEHLEEMKKKCKTLCQPARESFSQNILSGAKNFPGNFQSPMALKKVFDFKSIFGTPLDKDVHPPEKVSCPELDYSLNDRDELLRLAKTFYDQDHGKGNLWETMAPGDSTNAQGLTDDGDTHKNTHYDNYDKALLSSKASKHMDKAPIPIADFPPGPFYTVEYSFWLHERFVLNCLMEESQFLMHLTQPFISASHEADSLKSFHQGPREQSVNYSRDTCQRGSLRSPGTSPKSDRSHPLDRVSTDSMSLVQRLLFFVFCKSLEKSLEGHSNLVKNFFDSVGLFVMVILNDMNREFIKKHHLESITYYFDNLQVILWSQLELSLERHLNVLKQCPYHFNPGMILSSPEEKNWILLCQQYAQLVCSLRVLNQYTVAMGHRCMHGIEGPLQLLDSALEALLQKMSGCLKLEDPTRSSLPKRQAFMLNVYTGLLRVYYKHQDMTRDTLVKWTAMQTQLMEAYGTTLLERYFATLLNFVQAYNITATETLQVTDDSQTETPHGLDHLPDAGVSYSDPKKIRDALEQLAMWLGRSYNETIQAVYDTVRQDIDQDVEASKIFTHIFTQFLVYYSRFLRCVRQHFPEHLERQTIPWIRTIKSADVMANEFKALLKGGPRHCSY